MAGEIIQQGDLGPTQEDGYKQATDNLVVGPGVRYEFPSDYFFRVDGTTLVVYDGKENPVMYLAAKQWGAAIAAGAQVLASTTDDAEDNN